ncbi:MAG: hypothetical protein ACRDZY_22970, partial [Acidimicrobiales bacterium]
RKPVSVKLGKAPGNRAEGFIGLAAVDRADVPFTTTINLEKVGGTDLRAGHCGPARAAVEPRARHRARQAHRGSGELRQGQRQPDRRHPVRARRRPRGRRD